MVYFGVKRKCLTQNQTTYKGFWVIRKSKFQNPNQSTNHGLSSILFFQITDLVTLYSCIYIYIYRDIT